MNASKKRYDSKYKVTRIFLADYLLLKQLAQIAGVSMAEALHLAITDRARQERVVTPRTQIPIPLTTAYQVTTPVALRVKLQPTIATNGSKRAAFRIKTKGVRYE